MEIPQTGSSDGGSPIVPSPNQANLGGSPGGETTKTEGENNQDNSKNYEELEARLGKQGTELGEYRTFFENIAPLLDKLDKSPELVQSIIDGKIDSEIATAIAEGRVSIKDVQAVEEAHKQVKKNIGKEAYNLATPETVTKLVEKEVSKFRKEIEEKAALETFQTYSQKFIESTPDFDEHADAIDKWLDEHDVTDISVAYYAVKGQKSEAAAKEEAARVNADRARNLIANAGGGGQTAQFTKDGSPIVDSLISGTPNPNSIFG